MDAKVKIEITDDHITVSHNDEEIVHWVDDEWKEDPSIIPSIANAILLGTTDILELRRLVGKPLAKKTVKRLSKKEREENLKKRMAKLKELNITLRDKNAPFESTSLSGYITTGYVNIIALFGKPNREGDEHKVDAEWEFEMNGKVMTIYNYKDGKAYNGRNGMATKDITEWHIGSVDDVSVEIGILAKALNATSFQNMR